MVALRGPSQDWASLHKALYREEDRIKINHSLDSILATIIFKCSLDLYHLKIGNYFIQLSSEKIAVTQETKFNC